VTGKTSFDIGRGMLDLVDKGSPRLVPAAVECVNKVVWKEPGAWTWENLTIKSKLNTI
jgi:hypothetical protein